jgi:hypothetical protein
MKGSTISPALQPLFPSTSPRSIIKPSQVSSRQVICFTSQQERVPNEVQSEYRPKANDLPSIHGIGFQTAPLQRLQYLGRKCRSLAVAITS